MHRMMDETAIGANRVVSNRRAIKKHCQQNQQKQRQRSFLAWNHHLMLALILVILMKLHPSHCFQHNLHTIRLGQRLRQQLGRGQGQGLRQGRGRGTHLSPLLLLQKTQPAGSTFYYTSTFTSTIRNQNNHASTGAMMMNCPDGSSLPLSSSSCLYPSPSSSSSALRSTSTNTQTERCIEIEEKFTIANEIDLSTLEHTLKQLGFTKKYDDNNNSKEIEFMDWYFDLPEPNWVLSTTDNWFRYRELLVSDNSDKNGNSNDDVDGNEGDEPNGVWQIKCGRVILPDNNNNSCSGNNKNENDCGYTSQSSLSVYEEFESNEAIDLAMSIIQKSYMDKNRNDDPRDDHDGGGEEFMDGYRIPKLPDKSIECGIVLVPFARIKTTRSSWKMEVKTEDNGNDNGDNDNQNNNNDSTKQSKQLTVDIDATDFGHMVGEVEQVVNREEDVSASKEHIKEIISQIIGGQGSDHTPVLGKLELYMIRNRKKHFDACVKGGSMKERLV